MGAYAIDTVTWVQFQGRDNYGDLLAPVSVSVPARVTWEYRRVRDAGGNEVVSSGHLTMASRPKVDEDKIQIDGADHLVIAAKEIKSFSRVLGYRVYLQ